MMTSATAVIPAWVPGSRAHAFSSGEQTARAHRLTAPWDEQTVIWNGFAASFDKQVEAMLVGGAHGPISMDATGLVQAWIEGAHESHGLLLEENSTGTTMYRSR